MYEYTLSEMMAREKINLRAKDLGLKVDAVCDDAKVSRGTISRWTGDYEHIELGGARRVAEILEVTVNWLFDDEQGYPPPADEERPRMDARIRGLERILPPDMTREDVIRAVLEYELRRHAAVPAAGTTEVSVDPKAKQVAADLQRRSAGPAGPRATGSD